MLNNGIITNDSALKVLFLNPQQQMGGTQCLSAFLKREGYQTALVNDPNLFDNPWVQHPILSKIFEDPESILNQIEKHKPDLIGLSVVTDDLGWTLKWAGRIKKRFNIPIVFGNVHATFHAEDCLRYNCVDFIARGEGEITLLELVKALKAQMRGRSLKKALLGKPISAADAYSETDYRDLIGALKTID